MPKVKPIRRRRTSADQEGTQEEQGKPDRNSTRCISAHLPEDMYWQLKQLAVSQRVEMQTIIAQAANALFDKFEMQQIPVVSHGPNGKRQLATYHK